MNLESLTAYGAKTNEGMARCMNNESFYLRMVKMTLEDKSFNALKAAMEAEDAHAAFEAAHALKGITGNVSLTPIYEPVCALTDLLRGRNTLADGSQALVEQIMNEREKALKL